MQVTKKNVVIFRALNLIYPGNRLHEKSFSIIKLIFVILTQTAPRPESLSSGCCG